MPGAASRGRAGASARAGAKPLVIVESPAKARTIGGLLGEDYVVESSIGHIRDLPRRADEIPAAYKSEGWARLGVDVDNGFKPLYVVASEKKAVGRSSASWCARRARCTWRLTRTARASPLPGT